ncbi:MAG: stalk domain-containing protein [Bacillota bacterium]
MQHRWHRFRTLLAIPVIALSLMAAQPAQAADVVVNGYTLPWDQPPQIVGSRVLVPMRTFYEALGAQVDWEPLSNTITTHLDGITLRLAIGSQDATVNGQPSTLDIPAQAVNGRTMIPLRWVAEHLDTNVLWLDQLQTAVVRTWRPLHLQGGSSTYIVQAGDTLSEIAERYGVSVASIQSTNGLSGSMIYVGQRLSIGKGAALAHPLLNPTFVFPFPRGARYDGLYDTFGAGRSWSPDGPVARSHEGTDIMSPKGTPIVAAADGVITNFGWNQLGGWRITYRVDGTDYSFYYAHLSRYAPGLGQGSRVRAGQLLGYVGDSGYGPEGTTGMFDPHLHFGIYDGSFDAINAFPFLQFWQQNVTDAR